MRRILSLIIVVTLAWSLFDDLLFAQESTKSQEEQSESKVIDITADIVYPMTVNDTLEVMCLVGNFAAQHNGAIITADSAVRYNDKRLECFGNVLINKNTTYGYADRADYNGELNEVVLYAPIVKIVDGDATLYTYNFTFNTLDNIGIYDGGGVMINGTDVMESITGFYYADDKNLIGVGDVELRGEEYEMTSDSIIYNTEKESAQYFTRTNIWNDKDEYLYADAGDYEKAEERYTFTKNGYILTKEQEIWSDSMDYYRSREHVKLYNNIQIDDTTQKSLIFASYGEYLKDPGNMTLYGDPVVVSYDKEQGDDSLFMRADTIKMFTISLFPEDTTAADALLDSLAKDSTSSAVPSKMPMSKESATALAKPTQDQERQPSDHREEEERPAPDQTASQAGITVPQVPTVPAGVTESLPEIPNREGAPAVDDPTRRGVADSLGRALQQDTLSLDSLTNDSLVVDSLGVDSLSQAADTLNLWQRIKRNYNARRDEWLKKKAIRDAERKIILDSIAIERQAIITDKLNAEKAREARRIADRKAKIAERAKRKREKAIAKGKITADDTLYYYDESIAPTYEEILAESMQGVDSLSSDSLSQDSLLRDSMAVDSLAADSLSSAKVDSTYKLIKGYRSVKIYRTDFQVVADSMVSSSADSVVRFYLEPVFWHDQNQITADVMDIYTANEQIDKAVFTGSPLMASEVTESYYNQVAGREMTSLFSEGEMQRHNVDGNTQTIYYMQDEESLDITGMMVMESGDASYYIENQEVVGITYRTEPNYVLYPMSKIPADQEPNLKGFIWHAEDRPTREEVFDRTIRPSEREQKSELERPKFPINKEFEELRRDLINARMWSDRTDVVSALAEEWMESLGYKTGQPREEK